MYYYADVSYIDFSYLYVDYFTFNNAYKDGK